MTEWSPKYEDLEDLRPFLEVVEERGYNQGENAEKMRVGEYEGENVFVSPQDLESSSYDLMASALADRINYDVRVPETSHDPNEQVLITSEIGDDGELRPSKQAAESLINTYAFAALMGQADIMDNTSRDSEGVYAFDFENAGGNINGVYRAVRNTAQQSARENGLEQYIEDFETIGARAIDMAEEVNLDSLAQEAASRGVYPGPYQDIEDNIEAARNTAKVSEGLTFSPESSSEDEGVELL